MIGQRWVSRRDVAVLQVPAGGSRGGRREPPQAGRVGNGREGANRDLNRAAMPGQIASS